LHIKKKLLKAVKQQSVSRQDIRHIDFI
jgi:hypothetical protein